MFSLSARQSFRFLETGPLVDGELRLVEPGPAYLDDAVEAIEHPLSAAEVTPDDTRRRLVEFVENFPRGRQPAEPGKGLVPVYHFWMYVESGLPIRIAGGIGLRVGDNPELRLYSGHIGYNVYPAARGNHFAERAVRLIMPLAVRHRLKPVWITCNPDNTPSRRTCERLGAELVEVVDIPPDHPFIARGETQKCRYRLDPRRVVNSSGTASHGRVR